MPGNTSCWSVDLLNYLQNVSDNSLLDNYIFELCDCLIHFYENESPELSVDPRILSLIHQQLILHPELTKKLVDYFYIFATGNKDPYNKKIICGIYILCELLLVDGNYYEPISILEKIRHIHPNDLRLQDIIFRAKFYMKFGKGKDVGFELKDYFCHLPFTNFEILVGGYVHPCCAVWMRTSIGNIYNNEIDDIWNSDSSISVRNSLYDGSYRYCGKLSCPFIASILSENDNMRKLNKKTDEESKYMSLYPNTYLPGMPQIINLSYDISCNLSCPSCRSEHRIYKGEELIKIEEATERVVLPLLRKAELVYIAGSGDPFASKSYRHILTKINKEEYPSLKIILMTNGNLLTSHEWAEMDNLEGMIKDINVSVDAVTPDVYGRLRRGGDFRTLLSNLYFMGELLDKGAIEFYRLCFVIQKDNFRQMKDFVLMAKSVGANQVRFQALQNWGTFSDEDYSLRAVHLPSNKYHQELLEIISDPIFKDPIVTMHFIL